MNASCVTRDGSRVPGGCAYDDFVTCGIAAIGAGGSCKARSSLMATAHAAVPLPRPRKVSAAEHDKLFREFVRWRNEQHAAQ
jgi:hypothetical protein